MGGLEQEYEYKTKWTAIVLCAAFSGLCTVVHGSKALSNDRGLIINHIIELGTDGATTFYWFLTSGSAGFVVATAFLAYHRVAFRQRITFGPAGVTIPASRWSRDKKEIAYRNIQALSPATLGGQYFLYVMHSGGKYVITASMLTSKAVFEEVRDLLAAKVREARLAEQRHASP